MALSSVLLSNIARAALFAGCAAMVGPSLEAATARGHGDDLALHASVDFDRSVRPILAAKCFACHGPDAESRKAGLRLDTFEGATALLAEHATKTARAIVPGKPDESLILTRVASTNASIRMPPEGHDPLTEREIATLRAWIEQGAEYAAPWAFRPLTNPAVPAVRDTSWPRAELDSFVLATRESQGIAAPRDIDRMSLLRRASFDLRGLPPTAAEVALFESDSSDAAFERFVDAALAEPTFGERWGRHWLDLARYAETLGHEFDYEIPSAWRYRDYVIEAFNADVPPARLVAEHIAGDLIEPRAGLGLPNVAPIATMWWFLGPATHAPVDVRQDEADRIAGQVDVIGRSFFGLSIFCARCHDHKFDPIPASDFYALAGVARNTRRVEGFLDVAPQASSLLLEAARAAERAEEVAMRGSDAAGDTRVATSTVALGAVGGADATSLQSPPQSSQSSPQSSLVVVDTAAQQGARWSRSGPAFSPPRRNGGNGVTRIALAADGSPRTAELGTVDSAWLDERLVGSARSPVFDVKHRYIHVRVRGEASWLRVVIDNYWLDEANALLFEGLRRRLGDDDPATEPNDPREFPWRVETFDLVRFANERAYLELLDDGAGWIEVDTVAMSDDATPPTAEAWESTLDPDGVGTQAKVDALRTSEVLTQLVAARDALIASPAPMRALFAEDSGEFDEPVHVRGSSRNYGSLAKRAQVSMLDSRFDGSRSHHPVTGSGRVALAEALTDPATPYLWRTLANRVWLKLFARGIVETPDDFGQLGAAPSSIELLDHLASRLAQGATMKSLLREIMLSRAYQAAPDVEELPSGVWSAAPIRRLDAEAIRDAMLAVSGRLDSTRGGPSIPVHLTEHMQGRGRPGQSGPVDGDGRRSVYLAIRRNFLDPFLQTFDQPPPATTCGKRHASNVPAQSLAFLNSELVHVLAQHWAKSLMDQEADDQDRVRVMWRTAYGRSPMRDEIEATLAFLADERTAAGAVDDDTANRAAYTALAHVLFASKEFIYLR